MASSNQHGWDLKYPMEEADFHENKLPEDIGEKWKDLARSLGFNHAFINSTEKEKNYCVKECCIEVLVRWREQNGKGATAEKLAEALVKTGLKNVAERVPFKSSDPSQDLDVVIRDLEQKVAIIRSLITPMHDEVLILRARNEELERRQCEGNDASKEAKQAARESRVSETHEAKPSIVVTEVRQDNLPRTAVAMDFVKELSEHLEEQYNATPDIAPQACQCSEDPQRGFHDFAYRALQEMKLKIKEMKLKIKKKKKTLEETPIDDKEEIKDSMCLQKRGKHPVVKLEKWQRLLSLRRHTFPKGNKGRNVTVHDDTRDEELSLVASDSEGEEVEEPPKRRHTFPKGNKGRDVTEHDDTRDEKISLLTRDSKGGEEVEEPPK